MWCSVQAPRCSRARPQRVLCRRALDQRNLFSSRHLSPFHCQSRGPRLGAPRFDCAHHRSDSADAKLARTVCRASVARGSSGCQLPMRLGQVAASLPRPRSSGGRGVGLGQIPMPLAIPATAPALGGHRSVSQTDEWRRPSMVLAPWMSRSADGAPGTQDCPVHPGSSAGSSACSVRSAAWPASAAP